ncbi:hypothetical protein [Actinomadura bangladeshensis]|uniref:DUF4352 domain-containing protein n=1 Tax=Actinomadura bangladeshensis TaxID=453573 RepID=A0A6L9QBE4_9ACTN|nr:hypothetical protein [Actinomadura bangladeshensis]NEA21605.1 hypothetical protein [Actinomadura bangladeshensis]NEA22565.1 hypothetical protein [Actinomadura bangladeshensis]
MHLQNGEYKVTATVFSYRQPLRSQVPPRRGGYVYAGLEVRVCLDSGPGASTVSWDPWSLTYPDNTTIETVNSWSDDWFSVPLFPGMDRPLRPGRCLRGWVLFEVPKGKRPGLAEYAPTDVYGDQITDGPSWEL